MLPTRRLSHAQGYLELGMVAEAAAALDQIPAPENTQLDFLGVRLAVLQAQQSWTELRDAARDLVERVPKEASAWITWAYASRRADSLDAAEQILLAAELQHPAEPTIQFNLGCYACQRGDITAARSRVARAIALDPKFSEAARTDPDLAPLRERERP